MITDKLKGTLRDAIAAFVDDVLIDARRAPVRDRVRLAITMYSETSDQVESLSFEIGELADSLARSIQQAEDASNATSPTIVINRKLWDETVAMAAERASVPAGPFGMTPDQSANMLHDAHVELLQLRGAIRRINRVLLDIAPAPNAIGDKFVADVPAVADVASTITKCGICNQPAHASETNDAGNHPACEPES